MSLPLHCPKKGSKSGCICEKYAAPPGEEAWEQRKPYFMMFGVVLGAMGLVLGCIYAIRIVLFNVQFSMRTIESWAIILFVLWLFMAESLASVERSETNKARLQRMECAIRMLLAEREVADRMRSSQDPK